MKAADIVKYPFWTLALATGAKSFRDNKVIGSPALNRMGLHVGRIRLAHDLAWRRRRRLAGLVSPEDRAAFDRDGFVAKRNFLDPETFARLKEQTLNYQAHGPRDGAGRHDHAADRHRWPGTPRPAGGRRAC